VLLSNGETFLESVGVVWEDYKVFVLGCGGGGHSDVVFAGEEGSRAGCYCRREKTRVLGLLANGLN